MQENKLQIFKNENLGEIRIVKNDNEIWFCLKDICDILGLKNPSQVLDKLDDEERSKFSLGRQGEANFINESGLYTVILRSDKPNAKSFRKWVTNEVLPSIRKTGMYATDELLNNPDLLIKIASKLKEERARNKELESKIEGQKPQVIFANAVATAKNSILVGDLAKILKQNGVNIGQNRLFEWLRVNGYLITRKGSSYNMPTQKAMELELFEIKETAITHSDGHITINKTAKITGKGQQYFINLFIKNIA